MKLLSPFGPKIAIIKIPKIIINKINHEVDKILNNKKRLRKSDYSNKLVGQVQQEIQLDKKFIQKNLLKFIGVNVKKYIKKCTKKNVKKISLRNLWVVRQFKNEYNPIHYHGGHISGVGYLKVPRDMGTTVQKEKKVQHNGKLVLIDGSKKFLCNPTYVITPKVGEFYLFPSYMMHTVYPFSDTLEERRSVSFNAKIDDDSAKLR
jgi:uncharacterized protein (TIGR02466 family)